MNVSLLGKKQQNNMYEEDENKELSQETLQPYIHGCSKQVWRFYEQ